MNNNELNCPVDFVQINENKARVVALFVIALVVLFLVTAQWPVMAVLLVDFLLRSLNLNSYSPLAIVAGAAIKVFSIKNKPVDRAPKRFAAFVGVVFSAAILVTSILEITYIVNILAGVLILFAALESFFGFCAGCHVYSFLKRIKVL